jgi:2'-5' RNA ligase
MATISIRFKGGSGSGHFNHAGRPGEVGGSLSRKAGNQARAGMVNRIRNLQLLDENDPNFMSKVDAIVDDYRLSNNDLGRLYKSDIPFVLEAISRFPSSDLPVVWESYKSDDMKQKLESMAIEDGEDIDAYKSAAGIGRFNGTDYEINIHTVSDNEWISGLDLPDVMHNKAGTMVAVAAHEYAHSFDLYYKFSGTKAWDDAVKSDKLSVSGYGRRNNQEDFAESMALMAIRPAFFKKRYPARYDSIRSMLDWDPAVPNTVNKEYVGQAFDEVPYRIFVVTTSGYHLQLLSSKITKEVHFKELTQVDEDITAVIAFNFEGMFDALLDRFKPEDVVRDSHITLLNLGEIERIPISKENLMVILEGFAKSHAIIDGKITGVATFSTNPDEDGKVPIVLLYDSPQLPFFRVDLQRILRELGIEYLEQNHGFIPHITLAYIYEPYVEVTFKPEILYIDSLWLFWGTEKYSFSLQGVVVEKQLPIDDDSKKRLIEIRRNIFNDDVDRLAERMYTGEMSLGAWEETMKRYIRELHTSVAAIGKGGWDQMTWADWGRLGAVMREQYRYLHGFAEAIAENRETISINAIKARAHLYGTAAGHSAYLIEAGADIASQLPWLPKDGSTECLVGCKCQWDLKKVGVEKNMQLVQATWKLNPAEHCKTCIDRKGYVVVIRVPKDAIVPNKIGGY